MKKILWHFINIAIFVLLCLNTSLAQPAQQEPILSGLTWEISTIKEEFLPLEPIPLVLTLSNNTSQPIRGHFAFRFSSPLITLQVGKGDGPMRNFKGNLSGKANQLTNEYRLVEPGEKYQIKQLLAVNLDKNFLEPGSYKVQAVLSNFDGQVKIESNTLTLRILEPTGRELEALNYINKHRGPDRFFSTASDLYEGQQAQDELREFVSNFNGTAYGDYAAAMLGNFYLAKDQYEAAIELFEGLAYKTNHLLAESALLQLVKTCIKSRNLEKAKGYLEILKLRHPDSESIREAERDVSWASWASH